MPPPSEAIIRFVHDWNERHGESIRLEMGSLSEFCEKVRQHPSPIPVHRGDWPDWWSDGMASMPDETRMVREALRQARWLKYFAGQKSVVLPPVELARLEQNLMLYTEHTFNHSDAMSTPWDLTTKSIGSNKKAMAYAAFDASSEARDALFAALGEMPSMAPDLTEERFFFKVINPADTALADLARLYLEGKDFDRVQHAPVVTDLRTGMTLPCMNGPAPRGRSFDFFLKLEAGEEATFVLSAGTGSVSSIQRETCDKAAGDIANIEAISGSFRTDATGVETPWLKMDFTESGEIFSFYDKTNGLELLDPNRHHAPFTPVYEITPTHGANQCDVRRSFGRNRKGENVVRSAGHPSSIRFPIGEEIRIPVDIKYTVDGTVWFQLLLYVWRELPRVDATIRMQKTSVWDAENLYLALPFAVPGGQMWIDKPGGPLRPWQDQLPDTLTDWNCLQEGYGLCRQDFGLSVATPDAPLLQLGPLAHGQRFLMGHPGLVPENMRPYSWLMTNYWETNFEANLGGFHEFNYRIEWGSHLADPANAIRQCALLNQGLKSFRVRENA